MIIFFPEFHPVSGFYPDFFESSSNLYIYSVLTIFLNRTDVYFSKMIVFFSRFSGFSGSKDFSIEIIVYYAHKVGL